MPDKELNFKWYVYLLRCSDASIYTGITNDLSRRTYEHNNDSSKQAKYLRGRTPAKLVFQLETTSKSIALKIEHTIKKLNKKQKELIIQNFASRSNEEKINFFI